jgi:uncharacterized coiled-coil protein SlyX
MPELNDPFGGTQTLIDNADAALTALIDRVVAWQNLEVTETKNAQTRLLKIQELEAKNTTQKAEIDSLKLEVQALEKVRKSWWPILQAELATAPYAELVTAKNATGVLVKLREITQTVEVDPIPIDVLKADFAGLSLTLALKSLPIEVKTKWGEVVKQLLQLIQGVQTVSRATVAPIAMAAIADGILPSDYRFGIAKVSRLKQLNLEGRLTSPLDIIEAMGW